MVDKLPGSDLLRLAAQALLGRDGWDGPLEDCKRVDVCVVVSASAVVTSLPRPGRKRGQASVISEKEQKSRCVAACFDGFFLKRKAA